MKYENLSKQIIKAVGGKNNIISVVHCATRLRFTLKDESKANDEEVKAIKEVLSLVKKGGQYQLVIGNNVDLVYNDLVKIANINPKPDKKEKDDRSVFDKIIGSITGSIAPVIPLLAGCGMGKVLLLVLTMLGVLAKESQTYMILNFIFDTGFYFMPGFVGFSAAKIFGSNQYLGAFLGLVTVHPDWVSLVSAEKPVEFLGIGVSLVKYSSTLVPAILSVWIMSYIERFAKKIVPEMIKVFAEPLLIVILSVPLTFIVIGPVGNFISNLVAAGSMFIYNHGGFIAIPILAMVYPWLVSIGIHKALSPVSISLVAERGFDPIIRVVALCSNMAQAAASLAVSFKTKNKALKSLAFSSSMTAFLGGITEPAMYGVNLKLKKPMYASMIGGAVAGLFAGIVKLKAFIYVTPGLLSLAMWISEDENFLFLAIVTLIISSIVTFIATWILGFDDPIDGSEDKVESTKFVNIGEKYKKLFSPLKGELIKLENVEDETFASGIMGKGVAIKPSEGKLYAPCDGIVSAVFKTGHAIGITTEDDIEVLIHIGIDTVSLEGKYFHSSLERGQRIKQGDLLVEFDLEKIKEAGYDTTTMIIITNSNDYLDVVPVNKVSINKSDDLLAII
ncbi:PTS beta-glucoside transporter subunit IIBCA [Caldibacillus sp. 210928-DFI.2.22]|uniref:PTS beta-glucoside transporter subunit IIBCA n=1 Tax=unclassified Caldibacillus TaxID=2641266 RepID=UPI001D07A09E|nr:MULTISPECIES: PTS beta-glucoside transporter subunit IIBCA [unclassified Caldibacillus]MCB7070513.1 PTS beta-glucoside transporter subunit IIBCA [Caldibacillus sp. 210928-DFI.2.22]MCB7073845.1 PTS beta-glucoside transporter subunit IIBCA [Caldibacillus sp. 210928-DFI.2.18]